MSDLHESQHRAQEDKNVFIHFRMMSVKDLECHKFTNIVWKIVGSSADPIRVSQILSDFQGRQLGRSIFRRKFGFKTRLKSSPKMR